MEKQVIPGKHYWLTFEGNRVPLIIKVYNVTEGGLCGGLIYDGGAGGVDFSKGFHPKGPAWRDFNTIPEENGRVEVRVENIDCEISAEELGKLKRLAIARTDYFFDNNISKPFYLRHRK